MGRLVRERRLGLGLELGLGLGLLLFFGGCGKHDAHPSEASSPGTGRPTTGKGPAQDAAHKETRVFKVKDADDLLAVSSAYERMWNEGFDGTLEIDVGPAPIADSGFGLAPSSNKDRRPTIDVVIRGAGAAFSLSNQIRARSLRLENLALSYTGGIPLEIWVSTAFTMKHCALIDGRATAPQYHDGLIDVFADGGAGSATRVDIEDSWFVRNYQADDKSSAQLLRFTQRGDDAGDFDPVRVVRSAFLGNAFGTDLEVHFGRAVTIEDSLFFRNWGAGAELGCSDCRAVEVKGSRFVLEAIDQLATVEHGPAIQLAEGTRVMVRDWKAGAKVPAAVTAPAGVVVDRAAFGSAGDAAVTGLIQKLTQAPLTVPGPEAWSQLEAAFAHDR